MEGENNFHDWALGCDNLNGAFSPFEIVDTADSFHGVYCRIVTSKVIAETVEYFLEARYIVGIVG